MGQGNRWPALVILCASSLMIILVRANVSLRIKMQVKT